MTDSNNSPYAVLMWLAIALIGAWLSFAIAPFTFLYMGIRYCDWTSALACGMAVALCGWLMVHEAYKAMEGQS